MSLHGGPAPLRRRKTKRRKIPRAKRRRMTRKGRKEMRNKQPPRTAFQQNKQPSRILKRNGRGIKEKGDVRFNVGEELFDDNDDAEVDSFEDDFDDEDDEYSMSSGWE